MKAYPVVSPVLTSGSFLRGRGRRNAANDLLPVLDHEFPVVFVFCQHREGVDDLLPVRSEAHVQLLALKQSQPHDEFGCGRALTKPELADFEERVNGVARSEENT